MKIDAIVTAAVAAAFAQKLDGPATLDAMRAYSEAMLPELTKALGEGTHVRAVADCDNSNVVITVTNHGLRVRETRVVDFAQINAKAPPRRKTDDNPAPEVPPPPKNSRQK